MSIFPSLDNIKDDVELKGKINAKFSTIEYQYDTVLKNVTENIWNENVIIQDIINNYDKYLDYGNFQDHITRPIFQKLWTNERWLNCFYNALRYIGGNRITEYYRITICKITYDYCHEIEKPEQNIINSLYKIAEVINHNKVIQLSPIMYQQDALNVCIARYSDINDDVSIRRLNHTIMNLKYDFDQQKIITIYALFFDDNFGSLFRYTMTDTYCPDTDIGRSIYIRINYVLLGILNSMGRSDILNVLKSYSDYITLLNIPKEKLRFSLHIQSISKNYTNIANALLTLADDGYFVY